MDENKIGLTGFTFIYESHHYWSRERDPNDEWDSGDDGYNNYPQLLRVNNENPDCVGAIPLDATEAYLVWAEYTTGCTFGHTDGNVEAIAVFSSREKAQECAKQCEEHAPIDYSGWNMVIELENGETQQLYIPWLGYFESLNAVHVDCLPIERGGNREDK
jgi:hypothetical protein